MSFVSFVVAIVISNLRGGPFHVPPLRTLSLAFLTLLLTVTFCPAAAPADTDTTAKTHWSFRPLTRPPLPELRANATPTSPPTASRTNPIDAFITAKLAEKGLTPAPLAPRATLIRRLKFSLLGLPPTPEEVAAFLADPAPEPIAYAALVDRFLASPHYGERWARHWLDVVRFAESNGFEMNQARKNAWPYRDYVIRAFNEDKPYDRFILEQLAGDSLGADEATGFLVGGAFDQVKSPDPVLTANQRADELHDMVGTTGSAFLGLTVNCARCHDHKFDPIAMTDYYAMTACFAGVQHGERPLRAAAVDPAQTNRLAALRNELAQLESQLAQFDPPAHPARTLIIHADDPAQATALLPSKGPVAKYPDGTARGAAGDTGDAVRFPTLGRGYLYWNNVPGRDVFAWTPKLTGRFRVWLSWGAGHATHATDARYFLDRDGNRATRDDQTEIARANHQKFADTTGNVPEQRQWSGFLDAGIHDFQPATQLLLRGGTNDLYVTADVIILQEAPAPSAASTLQPFNPSSPAPRLRLPVTRGRNVERFAPTAARFLRFTIFETTQAEPCLDELEAFTAGDAPRNVALASAGARATASGTLPGHDIHKLAHVHDGLYGNSHSWISNERGRGWVQLEFAKTETIDRIVWSRDRDVAARFNDRVPTRYRIELSTDGRAWQTVASADDRLAIGTKIPGGVIFSSVGISTNQSSSLTALLARRAALETQLAAVAPATPMVYAGRFTKPGDTRRMHRGDPMQPREIIAPGGLARFGAPLQLAADTPEPERRLALARWIADPQHPLTARVIVNRLWHYHFGQGIVNTPSDFGLNGARPTHPELLDFLAAELIAQGWRLKPIHRLIVTSHAFRQASGEMGEGEKGGNVAGLKGEGLKGESVAQRPASTLQPFNPSTLQPLSSSTPPALAANVDAGNRLLWHFPARRLEAEALRDTILAVTGQLDLTVGGPGFDLFEPNTKYVKVYTPKQEFGPAEFRRMVYQNKPRMQLDDVFGAFDCPDAGQIAPRRTSSTTALQALNLLNSRFTLQQANLFAQRLQTEAGQAPEPQIHRAFQLAFSRAPDPAELRGARELITAHGLPALCRALLNANEFVNVF
ncbi:hypothetical protein LBMAG56_45110 [Verrucomicrobiota bacterium]|nr:hypothetical protein LBMAG56_45110 [Verrucomicrobiota bacterium]